MESRVFTQSNFKPYQRLIRLGLSNPFLSFTVSKHQFVGWRWMQYLNDERNLKIKCMFTLYLYLPPTLPSPFYKTPEPQQHGQKFHNVKGHCGHIRNAFSLPPTVVKIHKKTSLTFCTLSL